MLMQVFERSDRFILSFLSFQCDGEVGGLALRIDSQKPLNAALHFMQPCCAATEGDTSFGCCLPNVRS